MHFGDPKTDETKKFVCYFNKLFNCLDIRSLSEWKTSLMPDRKPYTSPNDSRLEVGFSVHYQTVCQFVRCYVGGRRTKKYECFLFLLSG